MTDPLAAHRALKRAENQIRAAEDARDQARASLDIALAAAGWRRSWGAYAPGHSFYTQGDRMLPLHALLAELGQLEPQGLDAA